MAGAGLGFQNRRSVLRDSLGGFDSHRLPPLYCSHTKVFGLVGLGEWKGTTFTVEVCSVVDFVCITKTEVSVSIFFHQLMGGSSKIKSKLVLVAKC